MTAPDPARLHQSSRQLEGDGGRVDVEQLRGLLAAATPGPWRVDRYNAVISDETGEDVAVGTSEADAAAIARMHDALPALLDLIRRQDAALTAVRELADGSRYKGIPVVGVTDIDLALASPDTTHEDDRG